jgi:hypothetical protein
MSEKTNERTDKRESWHGLGEMGNIGDILEKGVHESSVCDTGVYRFPNFHIFKQFPFQIPYNLDHFFQFSITFSNSFLPFQFPYPSIFATCYPFPEIFTSFPFPPNRANSPFYPSVRTAPYTRKYHFSDTAQNPH